MGYNLSACNYNYAIEYTPGQCDYNVDTLSRIPLPDTPKEI